ncbi:MAG: protein-disulfide reductase DsbD domain-containing protein [Candidatus Acidiferrales bacterium]
MFTIALLSLFGTKSFAKPGTEHHAQAQLIAEDDALRPGHTAWVGLLFDLDKGWHIYWTNPGDSGEPPRVTWELPAGFRAGEIRWPTPIRLGGGSIVDYGYEGRVLLMAPVETPANLKAGDTLDLAANVKWLVCNEICIPDKARLTLTVPTRRAQSSQPPKWQRLFRQTRQQLPKPMPAGWKAQAESRNDTFILCVETGALVDKATFFPLETSQIQNSALQAVTPFDRGLRLTLKKSEQLVKPVASLKGLIVLEPGGTSYNITAPVVHE